MGRDIMAPVLESMMKRNLSLRQRGEGASIPGNSKVLSSGKYFAPFMRFLALFRQRACLYTGLCLSVCEFVHQKLSLSKRPSLLLLDFLLTMHHE